MLKLDKPLSVERPSKILEQLDSPFVASD